jgi:signal transduction histidine kinase
MSDSEIQQLKEKLEAATAELEATRSELRQKQELIAGLNATCSDHQQQVVYSQRMASLGALVAGVTHEIKTPIGAINSMQDTLTRALDKLKQALSQACPEAYQENRAITAALKVIEDASKVIESGSARTLEIVRRVRKFAHASGTEMLATDLHAELDDTLLLLNQELKDRIEVVKRYGDLQPIVCNAGQINQVFLNVLVNASQAIEGRGTITITTSDAGDHVQVTIEDTGPGIPPEVMSKIFQTGFTTKRVGVGTGLGLSICKQIVEEHGGAIELASEPGEGARVTITLSKDLEPTDTQPSGGGR